MGELSNLWSGSRVGALGVRHISIQRLKPYLEEMFYDERKAVALYMWDRELSAAFFRDISLLEVALRNTIDSVLVSTYGQSWHRSAVTLFDSRTFNQIAEAWKRLPKAYHSYDPANGVIRGRLIASCMFGTWVSMLDAGGGTGCEPPCDKVDHDQIWSTELLIKAFPGGQKIAGTCDRQPFDRAWVHRQVRNVHLLRNRIAHHESLINGYPIPGENNDESRISARRGYYYCLRLAAMIDRDLFRYIEQSSVVPSVLEKDPRGRNE
ncbi:Abi family protein [Corynebacterium lowii]|uniref:Abi-like protein n=1 Tax=Corynebacterium lowii TaxID=1544413 RepID=A0A0Q0ZAM0_9CORY|nr:Abi family protein [Corynebacterium lowii]KQB86981.1 Abi-like protein [Corynebacterium lowii]MDP9852439.1 hypothetical protein [Corynebacterium lowii]